MIKLILVFGSVVIAAAATVARAPITTRPSFACVKTATTAERLICSDAELSRLDRIMAELHAETLSLLLNAEQASQANLAQRAWLKSRNRCADVQCLRRAYFGRVAELARDLPSDG